MMHTELILVHIVSKYLDKVRKASRTLYEIGGETGWMTRKLHPFPKIFPDSFSSLVAKFGKTSVCVRVSGLGADGLQIEVSLLKVN